MLADPVLGMAAADKNDLESYQLQRETALTSPPCHGQDTLDTHHASLLNSLDTLKSDQRSINILVY